MSQNQQAKCYELTPEEKKQAWALACFLDEIAKRTGKSLPVVVAGFMMLAAHSVVLNSYSSDEEICEEFRKMLLDARTTGATLQ